MTELRLIGSEGDYLVFESLSREVFKVLIDENLRSTIRNPEGRLTSSVNLTPREIQTEIRSGATVDDLIARSGDPRHYIEKFAAPVQDELSHVIASALSVQISIAGDRHTDISHTEFGEIIAARLEASSAKHLVWSCRRDENHSWLVTATFEISSEPLVATWSFDPKRLVLSPENETAIRLSTQNSLTETSFAKLKAAPSVTETVSESSPVGITETLADTQLVETIIPIGRASDFDSSNNQVDLNDTSEIEPAADLLEALKRKRAERAARDSDQPQPPGETQPITVIHAAEISDPLGEESQLDAEDVPPNPAPVRRNGRPSIPSFDEIVQGTKSEEE
jgi:hypothetical protein